MKNLLNKSEFFSYFKWKNDGFRSLTESVLNPELVKCLNDLKKCNIKDCVLIGGLAISYYLKPRQTYDIDLLFLTYDKIPTYLDGFKKNRNHAFLHKKTNVEIEVLTPEYLCIHKDDVEEVFKSYNTVDGINIASPVSLIYLKLYRFNKQDEIDIFNLINYCIENNIDIDLSKYKISSDLLKKYNEVNDEVHKHINEIYKNKYYLETDFSLNYNKKICINENDFDIYIFEENFGDKRIHVFSKDNNTRYCIDIDLLEILDSTTDYNSFVLHENLGKSVMNYIENNREFLKNKWYELNS